jgi:hypothetical protein
MLEDVECEADIQDDLMIGAMDQFFCIFFTRFQFLWIRSADCLRTVGPLMSQDPFNRSIL